MKENYVVQILEFIFRDFWTYIGVLVLLSFFSGTFRKFTRGISGVIARFKTAYSLHKSRNLEKNAEIAKIIEKKINGEKNND